MMKSTTMTTIDNFADYLQTLEQLKNNIIILVAAKDNIGKALEKSHAESFRQLGFSSNISMEELNSPYRSYIAILQYGEILVEKLGSLQGESVEYVNDDFSLNSHVYKNRRVDPIKMVYQGVNFSPNLRGINFVILDKNQRVVDRVNFDTSVDSFTCRRFHVETADLSEDDYFAWIGEHLSRQLNLGSNTKALFWPYANGDFYGAAASIQYCEAQHQENIIVLTFHKKQDDILSWFSYEDYKIKTFFLTYEEFIVLKKRHSIELANKETNPFGIIFLRQMQYEENQILTIHAKRFGEELRKPRFPYFDKAKYLCDYDISPGNTILIVPLAAFVKSFPDDFWNIAATLFESIGYKVLFNVPPKEAHRFVGNTIFAPLDDAVGLADLCGHVFAVRTGLLDFISTSVAKFTVFQPKYCSRFDREFKVDNSDGRVNTYYYDEDDFLLQKSSILKFIKKQTPPITARSLASNQKDSGEWIEPKKYQLRQFRRVSYGHVSIDGLPFLSLKYSLVTDGDNSILLKLAANDSAELPQSSYDIQVSFMNADNHKLASYSNCLKCRYIPETSGLYSAIITVTDLKTGMQEELRTESILYTESAAASISALPMVHSIDAYIQSLYHFREDLVILLCTRDTHTTAIQTRRSSLLKMYSMLGIHTDLPILYRYSFIAVIDAGVLRHESSSSSERLEINLQIDHFLKVHLVSKGFNYRAGYDCQISMRINDKEESMNTRGLNMVVWDKKKHCVVDSLVVDVFQSDKIIRDGDYDVPELFNGAKWFGKQLLPFSNGRKDNSFTGVKLTERGNKVYFKDGYFQGGFTGEVLVDNMLINVEKGIVRK